MAHPVGSPPKIECGQDGHDVAGCLGCTLAEAATVWFEKNGDGPIPGGMDVSLMLGALADVGISSIYLLDQPATRSQAFAFFHRCIDASLQAAMTGEPVNVTTGKPS